MFVSGLRSRISSAVFSNTCREFFKIRPTKAPRWLKDIWTAGTRAEHKVGSSLLKIIGSKVIP